MHCKNFKLSLLQGPNQWEIVTRPVNKNTPSVAVNNMPLHRTIFSDFLTIFYQNNDFEKQQSNKKITLGKQTPLAEAAILPEQS